MWCTSSYERVFNHHLVVCGGFDAQVLVFLLFTPPGSGKRNTDNKVNRKEITNFLRFHTEDVPHSIVSSRVLSFFEISMSEERQKHGHREML